MASNVLFFSENQSTTVCSIKSTDKFGGLAAIWGPAKFWRLGHDLGAYAPRPQRGTATTLDR